MSFSYDNFIRPLTSSDRVLKIYGDDGIVVYTINAFSVKSISVYANNLRINLNTDRLITINFSSNNEAKMSIGKLRTALDVLQNKEPLFISKDIQEYVNNNVFGSTGSTGSTGAQGPKGDVGSSAYDIWLGQGNIGTVNTFFSSLSGTSGFSGTSGVSGSQGLSGTSGTSGIGGVGSNRLPTKVVSSDYVINLQDHTVRVDATSSNVTITLPSCSDSYISGDGYIFVVKRVDSTINSVYLVGTASELIDGSTQSIIYQYDSYTLQSNGTSWDIL